MRFVHAGFAWSVLAAGLLGGLGTGCWVQKHGAQIQAERLSQNIRNDAGAVGALRKWFADLESASRSGEERSQSIPIPNSLRSAWWRQARASASWSDAGRLEYIIVMDPAVWEMIRIGPPHATAQDLHLAGPPPVFPAKIADGIYASIRYK